MRQGWRLLEKTLGKKNFTTLILKICLFSNLRKCRLTFKVTDVFAVAIKKLRSNFSNSKNVVEEIATKGEARLAISGTRAAERRRSCYRVLCDVFALQYPFFLFFI